jgi:hypothetical protein
MDMATAYGSVILSLHQQGVDMAIQDKVAAMFKRAFRLGAEYGPADGDDRRDHHVYDDGLPAAAPDNGDLKLVFAVYFAVDPIRRVLGIG